MVLKNKKVLVQLTTQKKKKNQMSLPQDNHHTSLAAEVFVYFPLCHTEYYKDVYSCVN